MLRLSPAATPSNLSAQPDTVTGVAKTRPQYRCSECHHVTAKWVGRCPDCGTWGTVDEVAVLTALGGSAQRSVLPAVPAVPISSIDPGGVRHYAAAQSRVHTAATAPASQTTCFGRRADLLAHTLRH